MGVIKVSVAALAAAGSLTGAMLAPVPASANDIVINMAAPDWLPTRFMQEEFDKTYKAQVGQQREPSSTSFPGAASTSASRRRCRREKRNIR